MFEIVSYYKIYIAIKSYSMLLYTGVFTSNDGLTTPRRNQINVFLK
jgi:hypothetical protein